MAPPLIPSVAAKGKVIMQSGRRKSRTESDGGPTAKPEGEMAACLRALPPLQEKVVRLRYGLGCASAHWVRAIAHAFAMPPEVIGGILIEAESRLKGMGLQPDDLRAAARDGRKTGAIAQRRMRWCRDHGR